MLKRFILWDYPRASWQYDVMVGLILAFIFLTPRAWFRDQPRLPGSGGIAVLPAEKANSVYFVNPDLLANTPDEQRIAKATGVLANRMGRKGLQVTRVEPILSSEGELQGYLAFTRP
jgi:hypothetical protein